VIPAYFAQIKALIDRYASTSFVLDSTVNFDIRPGQQGYLSGSVSFVDSSRLYFREYLDVGTDGIDKLTYSYHYQNASNQLVFRYDNAQHKPILSFREHKHNSTNNIIEAEAPTIDAVLIEIAMQKGWIQVSV
jgi:hypothetical protein